jgi:lipoprotein-anchoring transpeptidase ErfK/SrfK
MSDYTRMYAANYSEPYAVPAVDLPSIDARYLRQRVPNNFTASPGSVIVDTNNKFLYFVESDTTAIRYGVGIGRAGFEWSGTAVIAHKKKWPTWTPPSNMIDRQPELERWRNGMPPGQYNPLGSRALYIHSNGVDTLYRIHGTHETWTIGTAASSGCVRMINQDIIDLYGRVSTPTTIVVR